MEKITLLTHLFKCFYCGSILTRENVRAALDDAGVETPAEQARIMMYCPTYSDEGGCREYCEADRELPAYWRYA